MRKGIIGVAAALALAGCSATPDGSDYQFGDITGAVLSMQAEYCAEQDPRRRAFRIAALRAAGVPIPPSGACTDILTLVPEEELDVDVEQAERDQERFRGRDDSEAAEDNESAE